MSPRGAARRLTILALLLLAPPLAALRSGAQETGDSSASSPPPIPTPVGFVNDRAGVMDEQSRARLEAFLDQVRKKTGVEFAVLTVRSTAPLAPSEYKVLVFERWGLGKKGEDNGLLMLVAIEEREVRFETGYGLEGTLPDGLQSRIFRQTMAPRFREGDFAGGIIAGVTACAARIAQEKGVSLEWNGQELRYESGTEEENQPSRVAITIALIFVVMLLLAGMSRRSRRRRGWSTRGGFGGWGGSFGGGGGGFGGFGGGSSGGGGGGGSW